MLIGVKHTTRGDDCIHRLKRSAGFALAVRNAERPALLESRIIVRGDDQVSLERTPRLAELLKETGCVLIWLFNAVEQPRYRRSGVVRHGRREEGAVGGRIGRGKGGVVARCHGRIECNSGYSSGDVVRRGVERDRERNCGKGVGRERVARYQVRMSVCVVRRDRRLCRVRRQGARAQWRNSRRQRSQRRRDFAPGSKRNVSPATLSVGRNAV